MNCAEMESEARQEHVSAPAGPLFVDMVVQHCRDTQKLVAAGALNVSSLSLSSSAHSPFKAHYHLV